MANPMRRIVSSSKDDTATDLSIGVQWESLRAACLGHYGKTEMADDCFLRAQKYDLELEGFLERANKG